ncbi:unnamed protein product [Lampetra planeri]
MLRFALLLALALRCGANHLLTVGGCDDKGQISEVVNLLHSSRGGRCPVAVPGCCPLPSGARGSGARGPDIPVGRFGSERGLGLDDGWMIVSCRLSGRSVMPGAPGAECDVPTVCSPAVEVIVGQVAVPGCRVARAVSGQVVSGNDGKGPGIPVPSGVAYRVTGLTPSTSYSVVLRHPTSGVQSVPGILSTANARTPRSAVDAEAFSRSGGMVVITVILSVLIFLLIAILVAALLLGNKN